MIRNEDSGCSVGRDAIHGQKNNADCQGNYQVRAIKYRFANVMLEFTKTISHVFL